ncbi:GPP34 family phosphoprotein [Pseudonocardia sp. KRD291]|uniref:GOLPH3/VPS74 family protein n=1 Tax=Pseudonocardia sp. KRD291 TaxID=2792007 RepID=UPI001C4A4620|nr:GPP34 family phosphoprotein [Pseudonocardia sp. KRD291]MBW0102691.1 GPP34 family phosphoprotein [Pseudonocardia sp. KRD291]
MEPSLPRRMYLLCYKPERDRLESASVLARGTLMRGAALAQLAIEGHLRDRDGRAERTRTAAAHPTDPFLAEVLESVSPTRPRHWFTAVEKQWHTAEATVRDQLADDGTITVARRRILGLIPLRRVSGADPTLVRDLQDRVRDTVTGGHAPHTVPIEDAALAVFCVDGDVRTVLTPRRRRENKAALRALTAHLDETLPALRKAVLWSVAARRSAAAS